jgi:phosphatidylinositol alpha 1,6-mannosyltransferase
LRENQIENVHYWPRGVDSLAFSPAHRDGALRSALAPRGELIVGFIGRLAPEKRPLDLAPISQLDGVKLVVVGDGPEARNLKAHTRGAMFFGELRGSALARVMASLDVLVHTGWHETFCQTVQESLASAVPVIAPPAGGPRDLVSHGKTGWLIDTKCPRTLADLVTQLRDNREQVRQKRPVARESVSARTWSKVGNALLEHYYQALGEPLAAPTQKLATVTTLHESASTKETIDSVQQAA